MTHKHQLPSVWFHGIDPEKKEEFEGAIRNSTVALSKLYEILESYWDQLDLREMNEETFKCPEWANLQAYYGGQKKSIHKIMSLIEGIARPHG